MANSNQVTGETRTHNHRGHIPALCPLSYGHREDDWIRTSVSGLCRPAPVTTRPRPQILKHAVQGSNLPTPGLESGVPPLELTAYGSWPVRREGVEPPMALRPPGLQPGALPFCHLRESQRGRIRTFDPVRPRHVRCQTAPHAESRLLPEGIEPIMIRLKAGHPDRWTTGARNTRGWIRTTK
jgi:hypothetical protein